MDREQDISFVFENGVLKPDGPIDFPEGARGIAHIREVPAQGSSVSHQAALETIRRIGSSKVFNSGGHKFTREQMHERP